MTTQRDLFTAAEPAPIGPPVYGVTGSRRGPSIVQMETLQAVFARCRIDGGVPGVLVHGACVGVDITAAILAYCRGWRVHALPAADADAGMWRDLRAERHAHVVEPPAPPLERNRRIVDLCSRLLALPAHPEDDPRSARSGTWATIRYARAQGRSVLTVMPDGSHIDAGWRTT